MSASMDPQRNTIAAEQRQVGRPRSGSSTRVSRLSQLNLENETMSVNEEEGDIVSVGNEGYSPRDTAPLLTSHVYLVESRPSKLSTSKSQHTKTKKQRTERSDDHAASTQRDEGRLRGQVQGQGESPEVLASRPTGKASFSEDISGYTSSDSETVYYMHGVEGGYDIEMQERGSLISNGSNKGFSGTVFSPPRTPSPKNEKPVFFVRWVHSLKHSVMSSNLYGDYSNITLLFFLYVLQAVPMGISAVIPIIMQERKLGYGAQAAFTVVSLPFSFKLLWAPLVDSYYSSTVGRRKSWIIPTQFICAFMLLGFANMVDEWLGSSGSATNTFALTVFFLTTYILMATQDIAVDAWALTMLQKKNVGYASTTNTLGQIIGVSIAQLGYLLLSNPETCNKYFRSTPSDEPMLGIRGMLKFWGVVFFVSTVFLTFAKSELSKHPWDVLLEEKRRRDQTQTMFSNLPATVLDEAGSSSSSENENKVQSRIVPVEQKQLDRQKTETEILDELTSNQNFAAIESAQDLEEEHTPDSLRETLELVLSALKLPSFQLFVLFQLTCRIVMAPTESIFYLKLLDYGIPKSDFTIISSLSSPIAIITSIFASKYTAGPNSMKLYLLFFIPRVLISLLSAPLLYIYPSAKSTNWIIPLILLRETASNAIGTVSFMACMAFSARISDPRIGGTIMTMLNTASNLGAAIPRMIVLSLVEYLSIQECILPPNSPPNLKLNRCSTDKAVGELCAQAGGKCNMIMDGFYIEVILFGIIGGAWLCYILPRVASLASLPASAWRLSASLFNRSEASEKEIKEVDNKEKNRS